MKSSRIVSAIVGLAAFVVGAGNASAQSWPGGRPDIWSGFYLGAHLGGGWSDGDGAGIVGGGHAGYNWQSGNLVFGIEGDFSGTGIEDSSTASNGVAFATAKLETDWLASIRGRIGASFGNVLIYGTGGVAWSRATLSYATNFAGFSGSSTDTAPGWVLGAGAEMKFDRNWSGRVEGLYYGLDREFDFGNGLRASGNDDTFVVRGGITYHFN